LAVAVADLQLLGPVAQTAAVAVVVVVVGVVPVAGVALAVVGVAHLAPLPLVLVVSEEAAAAADKAAPQEPVALAAEVVGVVTMVPLARADLVVGVVDRVIPQPLLQEPAAPVSSYSLGLRGIDYAVSMD
jgi:hypothetical protein